MVRPCFLPFFTCAFLSMGLSNSAAQSIVGTWKLFSECGFVTTEVIDDYREDGTYTSTGTLSLFGNSTDITLEGEWSLEGTTLLFNVLSSNAEDLIDEGSEFVYELISVDDSELVYTDGACEYREQRANRTVPAFEDKDGDGMGDAFEETFFGSIEAGIPDVDTDLDGQTNIAEFTAMTDPTDASSRFRAEVQMDDGKLVISFLAVPGRIYRVQRSADLKVFADISDEISRGTEQRVEVRESQLGFYRVSVAQQ